MGIYAEIKTLFHHSHTVISTKNSSLIPTPVTSISPSTQTSRSRRLPIPSALCPSLTRSFQNYTRLDMTTEILTTAILSALNQDWRDINFHDRKKYRAEGAYDTVRVLR